MRIFWILWWGWICMFSRVRNSTTDVWMTVSGKRTNPPSSENPKKSSFFLIESGHYHLKIQKVLKVLQKKSFSKPSFNNQENIKNLSPSCDCLLFCSTMFAIVSGVSFGLDPVSFFISESLQFEYWFLFCSALFWSDFLMSEEGSSVNQMVKVSLITTLFIKAFIQFKKNKIKY